ncbi:hypothetical protein D3C73_1445300 [compost metagenome]
MLVWLIAIRLPNRIEQTAMIDSTMRMASLFAAGAYKNRRIITAKMAILLAVAKKVETGAGAPW